MYAVAMETMFGLLDYPTLHNNGGAMYPCIGCWGGHQTSWGRCALKKWRCNSIHNILEFCKVLVQFPFTVSKTELDI